MKILVLVRYGSLGASSRMRFLQYLPAVRASGNECVVLPLIDDALLLKKYRRGSYGFLELSLAYWRRIRALLGKSPFDLVWIEKEALPWFPLWIERLLLRGKPYVLDFDDAIFHNYDRHRLAMVRSVYGRRIDRLMARARLILAGNRYLADRATMAGAQQVEYLPTVVDLTRYPPKRVYAQKLPLRIVWIGSPSTAKYLLDLVEPLSALAARQPFTLRVIGGGAPVIPGVTVEALPWSEETEAALIAESDIGIMPLRDSPWERGKCAYKLIQYMACGLPTVASPIGANCDVVGDGKTGFLAGTSSEWIERLERLLSDAVLRELLGRAGRESVEAAYCLQQTAPRMVRLLAAAGHI